MSDRITGAMIEKNWCVDIAALCAQLDEDATLASRLERAERDLAGYDVIQKVLAHPERERRTGMGWCYDGSVWCFGRQSEGGGTRITAPSFVDLLAQLNALAKPRKPKEEWVWRWDDGAIGEGHWPTAAECASAHASVANKGRPMRRVTHPDGRIELIPEGVA